MNTTYLHQVIEKVIKEHQWLKIDYVDSKMQITSDRVIEPIELAKDNKGRDVVYAHCFLKNGFRAFQFEGIQKIKATERNYQNVTSDSTVPAGTTDPQ